MSTAPLPRDTAGFAPGWQRELADAIRDPEELCRVLGLDSGHAAEARESTGGFPLLVPRAFVTRMLQGDALDPLLLHILPRRAETIDTPGFSADPLDEAASLAAPGLVRKYAGRALLLLTGGCAINCRYCFRREFPYAASGATRRGVDEGLDAIAADPSISEVILSGGDPLLVDDSFLRSMVARLDAIAHLRRLRIHTRLPIVLPSRITPELVAVLGGSRLARVVVLHANHPAELDAAVAEAARRLASAPALVLNQTVLLSGVNDSAAVLRSLSERLVELGVVPYYLHLLDRVRGAAHFDVPDSIALRLHRELRDSLPGYAVPRLVREVPGEPAKVWMG